MKLFTRYARLNLWAMLAVFLVGAGALFFTFRYILIHQVDESLDIERDENLQYIQHYGHLHPPVAVSDQIVEYRAVAASGKTEYRTIRRQGDDGVEDFRQLSFPVLFEGRHYQFFVSTPLEHTQHLLRAMALVTLAAIALMMLLLYGINRALVRRLLRPFYHTLDAIKGYALTQRRPLNLPPTGITEFSTLNQTLNEMAARLLRDYQLVRDFTAQAAHEMQTPLAVVRTKLETLMQSPEISEAQATQVGSIDDSVERLTRLFKSLLMLTKIENGQFPTNETLALNVLAKQKLEDLQDLMDVKGLTTLLDIHPVDITANRYLAEMLVSNLLNNAIRYNKHPGGEIAVLLRPGRLFIANTSALPSLDAAAVGRPFYRHPDSGQDGSGLGLSIVRQICEACGFRLEYRFADGRHQFSILF